MIKTEQDSNGVKLEVVINLKGNSHKKFFDQNGCELEDGVHNLGKNVYKIESHSSKLELTGNPAVDALRFSRSIQEGRSLCRYSGPIESGETVLEMCW